jgi:2',3'-cyclic-nucleotide 2'-phosphodiesterase (5'-nucleotidase family)
MNISLKSSLAVLGLFVLSATAGAQTKSAVILSTASVGGETITCGCQKKELGGLARRTSFVKTQRAKNPATIVVDAGDFGSHLDFEPWMRTEFQIDMMSKIGYDVVTPGPSEMVMGLEKQLALYARAPQIKVVSANIVDKKTQKQLWDDFAIIDRGGVKFAVTGVTDREAYKFKQTQGQVKSDDFDFKDPKAALQRVIPQMRQKADVVVVLLHTGSGDAKHMMEGVTGADAVIVGHLPEYKFMPEVIAGTPFVQTGARGQYMGRLELNLSGNKVVGHSGEAQALGETVAIDPEMDGLVKTFNKKYDAMKARADAAKPVPKALPKSEDSGVVRVSPGGQR